MCTDAIDDLDMLYDERAHLIRCPSNDAGYHSRVPLGTLVHPTRESLRYARELLRTHDSSRTGRAAEIIRAVLRLQDTVSTSRTYGIWPYYYEEPLARMSPPDWNWADFCGAELIEILHDNCGPNPVFDDVRCTIHTALGHAAWSIFRRNVGPSYTNIASKGSAVAIAAGELLNEPRLLEYGRQRLANLVEHGRFDEYNSPTYAVVTLLAAEQVLRLVRDPAARDSADALRRRVWEVIAGHFHPPTQQWAGPHSRAYWDRLPPDLVRSLSQRVGMVIEPHSAAGREGHDVSLAADGPPCPTDLAERFRRMPASEIQHRELLVPRPSDCESTWGTTWMTESAALATASYECLWAQRRPLIGHLRTSEDKAVVLRLRFLRDGRDFASAILRTAQHGPRILATIGLATNLGDFHLMLDRPADGVFHAEEFRVRLELSGNGVRASQIGEDTFALFGDPHRIAVHAPAALFHGSQVVWRPIASAGFAALECVCWQGPQRAFDLAEIADVRILLALHLLTHGHNEEDMGRIQLANSAGVYVARWGNDPCLEVRTPLRASRYGGASPR